MGFSRILTSCALWPDTCYSTYEDRLELVNQINTIVFPKLLQTYQKLKAAGPPDMRIYVIGYPQIAKPGGDCALNVRLNSDEVQFSQDLINYLDSVIQIAAAKTGVDYVDVQDALYGHRLCEAGPGSIAINGLTAGNDRPTSFGGPIGDESYHPNPRGYQLLEDKILAVTSNMTSLMPTANTSLAIPAGLSQDILNAPHSGRTTNAIEYDPGISGDLAYQQVPADISINGTAHSLKPNSPLVAELHSTPTNLGSFSTDGSGNLATQVTIPANVSTGYHTIHFFGTDIAGQTVDIYKDIYVAATADDLDGNGIADITQACIGVPASGIDFDQDGIDDACDGDIGQPPAISPSSSSGSLPSELTNSPVSANTPNQQGASNSLAADSSQSDILYSNTDSSVPVVLADSTQKPQAVAALEPVANQPGKLYYLTAAAVVLPVLALIYILSKRLV